MDIQNNFRIISNNFELNEKDFAKILYQTNAFISGGSALNVFLERNFNQDQDLDIFVRIPYTKETDYQADKYCPFETLAKDVFDKYLTSNGYKISGCPCTFGLSMSNKNTNEIEYYRSALRNFVKGIINYKKGEKKVQLIILYDCTIHQFMDTFDLNICKLVIKGVECWEQKESRHFYKFYKLEFNNTHLSENDLNLIKENKMYINRVMYPYNLENRVRKYLSRGFTLVDAQEYKPIIEN